MIPKLKRVRDPKAILGARKLYCERCRRPAFGEPHHIFTRGAGGPDIKENLIQLCTCHDLAHRGKIPRQELMEIVARREGTTADEIERIIRGKMRT